MSLCSNQFCASRDSERITGYSEGSDAGKGAVWYRRTIEVPKTLNGYDLTGVEVSFRFLANANGPIPEILYFNGRRVAMGDNLEQVQLFGDAKPGDKILVAVKLLPTVDVKRFESVEMKIAFAANRPDPDDLRKSLCQLALWFHHWRRTVPLIGRR